MNCLWTHFVKLWEPLQVELHGKYSAERVLDLAKYSRETSWVRVITILLVTPLPCLLVTVFIDILPLADPSEGLEANTAFFVREHYTFMVMTFLAIQQFRMGMPILSYPFKTQVRNTILVSALVDGTLYGIARTIGFPVPFSLLIVMPLWVLLVFMTLGIEWANKFREIPGTGIMMKNLLKLWTCQVLLVFIYPSYFFVFTMLSYSGQMAFALLLPVIKLSLRNFFARTVFHLIDEMPEVVVFNVEIFNALFLSYCMQSSPSVWTTLAMMFADVLIMGFSLRDTESVRRSLHDLERRDEIQMSLNSYHIDHGRAGRKGSIRINTLERTRILLSQEARPDITLVSPFVEYKLRTNQVLEEPKENIPARGKMVNKYIFQVYKNSRRTIGPVLHEMRAVRRLLGTKRIYPMIDTDRNRLANLSATTMYTRKIQKLLYMAEFILLRNYVEVIIPLVFSIYLVAMYHLPNRNFYTQISGMDHDHFFSTLKNVLFYCFLQFISLLALIFALQRKLGLSPIHVLAFVLEKQYAGVQTKLVFWVYYNVQTSLQHQGYDYAFQFSWLQH